MKNIIFYAVIFLFFLYGCVSKTKEIDLLTNYLLEENGLIYIDSIEFPISVDWEKKSKNVWYGKTKTSLLNFSTETMIIVFLDGEVINKIKLVENVISPSLPNYYSFDKNTDKHFNLIQANLNSYIDRYELWEIKGDNQFWIKTGLSMGARGGEAYVTYYLTENHLMY